MLPVHGIEKLFSGLSPQLLDIVLELRNVILGIAPSATETLHRHGLTYYEAGRGGPVSAGICQIHIQEDHIRLAFIHGAFLPDPRGLLEAEGDRKYKRFVRIYSFEQAPWEDLKALIIASHNFDPYSLVV